MTAVQWLDKKGTAIVCLTLAKEGRLLVKTSMDLNGWYDDFQVCLTLLPLKHTQTHIRSMKMRRPSSHEQTQLNSILVSNHPSCLLTFPLLFSINRRASKRPSAAARLYYTTSVEAARLSMDQRSLCRRDTSSRPDSSNSRIKCRYEIAVLQLATDRPIVSLVSHRLLVFWLLFQSRRP